MKKIAPLLALPLLLFLFGCPVGIKYSPGTPGTEKIDEKLIGTWETATTDAEFKKAIISKKDAYSLNVSVQEKGEMYALTATEFTGWTTSVDNQKIIYIFDGEDQDYYMYGYNYEDNGLMLYDVSLLDGGVDAVTSTETFRKQLSTSLKKPDCLNDKKLFVKK